MTFVPLNGFLPARSPTTSSLQDLPFILSHGCTFLLKHIGPRETNGRRLPCSWTVIYTAIVFIIYILYTILVLRFGPLWLHYPSLGIAGLASTVIISLSLVDFGAYFICEPRRTRPYSRNLGNTIITVVITVPLMAALNEWVWYPQRIQLVQQITNDKVTQIQFPAVAVLQQTDFSSQAHLLPGYSKCFLGWYDDTSPKCSTLNASDINTITRCNCKETWSPKVIENFNWRNHNYRYLSFQTPPNLVSSQPAYLMMLQTFFNFNGTKAKEDSSFLPSPSLSVAIYDPKLNLLDALNKGYTRLIDFNALGTTAINLGINTRQALDADPVYDYDLQISSVPAIGIVCDVMKNGSYPCVSILRLSFPTFSRTNIKEQKGMDWPDMYAAIGSYYSFVQFFSWVASGALWAV